MNLFFVIDLIISTRYLILTTKIRSKLKSKFLIFVLAINLLISTIGIPISIHICEKSGISFFSKCESCSHIEEQEVDCCGNVIHKSVAKSNISCCTDEVRITKADINLNFEQIFELEKSEVVEVLSEIVLSTSIQTNYIETSKFDIPPPDFGKKLIIKKNEFKLDILSC